MFHSPDPLELLSLFLSLLSLAVSLTTYWFVRDATREVLRRLHSEESKTPTGSDISQAIDLLRDLDRQTKEKQ